MLGEWKLCLLKIYINIMWVICSIFFVLVFFIFILGNCIFLILSKWLGGGGVNYKIDILLRGLCDLSKVI